MSTKLLLPNKYKKFGWIILIPACIAGLLIRIEAYEADWLNAKVFAIWAEKFFENPKIFSVINTNITNTVVGSLFIIGGLLVGFSKEKNEDEFISNLRLSSLLWAVLASYILLLAAFLFIYGSPFLDMMIYNMFTVLIIFIARFNYILYRNSKNVPDEK